MIRHLPRGKNKNSTDIICIPVKYDEWKMNRVIDVKLINPYNNCILRNIIFLQYLSVSIGLVDQMGARFDLLRCEIFQNLFLSPMNTGFVRPAVATVLTVYGIEPISRLSVICFTIRFKARLMIMRDYIEDIILDGEFPKLEEAKNACNVYTIAIESDDEFINLEVVKVEDYNEVVDLYNSLIDDLVEGGLAYNYSHTIKCMKKRFFKI